MTDLPAQPGTGRGRIWAEFEAWEQEAASKGSGMTRDQMTGAVMFEMWLSQRVEARQQGRETLREIISRELTRFEWGRDGVGLCSWCGVLRGSNDADAHSDDCPLGALRALAADPRPET